MNSGQSSAIPGKEILQALENMGALDDIRPQLKKNFEGVMRQLQTIPTEVIYNILDIKHTPLEVFIDCARNVEEILDTIRVKSNIIHIPLIQKLESKIKEEIKTNKISSESLRLTYNYLQVFCKKYPPRKVKNSIHPEDDDVMYVDPYTTLDGENSILLGNDTRKIGENEIETLCIISEIFQKYTQNLKNITLWSSLNSEGGKKCLQNEHERMMYMKKISHELLKMFSWAKSRTPYMSLCEKGGPFRGKTNEHLLSESVKDLLSTLGRLSL